MELDNPHLNGWSRLRLIDVRVDGDRGHLHFGPHLSGVLTASANRSDAAEWIASTVVGPRAPEADGTVEIDGKIESVWSLGPPLLPADAPMVIDFAIVHAQWREACGLGREHLAAAHASCRLECYRLDAALAAARDRLPLAGAPAGRAVASAAPEPVEDTPEVVDDEPAHDEPAHDEAAGDAAAATDEAATTDAPVDWAHPPDAMTPVRAQLRSALAALDEMKPEPLAEGLLLADAWDAHAALLRARDAADELPVADIDFLEQRVNAARIAVENASKGVSEETRAQIEQCHRAVVEAEAQLFDAKRKERPLALERYDAAVAEELVALSAAGLESYASFLFEISGGGTPDPTEKLAAEAELADARMELDLARLVPDVPTRLELEQREAQMRARASELLGHAPGADPPTELRALMVQPDGRAELLDKIATVLQGQGVIVTDDGVTAARDFLAATAPPPPAPPAPAARPPAPPANPPTAAESASAVGVGDPVRWREVADLEEQRAQQQRRLARLEVELARLDRFNDGGTVRLVGADLTNALEAVFNAYRSGRLLAGRLPLIIDGVLDGLTLDARERALGVFARAADVQIVVVTDDPEVMQSLSREGGTLVRWPDSVETIYDESERQAAPTAGA